MQTRSDIFDEFCRLSHTTIAVADVLYEGAVVAEDLALIDGYVTHDATAAIQGRASFVFAEPLRLPSTTDALSPYGYEIVVRKGIEYPGGREPELMPLGVFPIQTSEMSGDTLLTQVACMDRSQSVSEARFEDVYQVPAGTNYGTAIQAVISAGVPGLTFLFPETTQTTPLLTFPAQDDRWQAARGMARAIGMVLFFDGLGRCVMKPETTLGDASVLTVSDGDGGVLTAASVKRSRLPAYNKVVAASANAFATEQYRAEAVDDDPASPTYYYGGFRRKPRFFVSPLIGSQEQAQSSADSLLASALGIARSIDFAMVPNYALEVRDLVRVDRSALGVNDELHILDVLTIPLDPESPMTAASRSRQVAS